MTEGRGEKKATGGGGGFNSWSATGNRDTATHLTEKRWAGRSPLPPEGSPRPTVPSPASFLASLRSRADNYMSKYHSHLRARGGDLPPLSRERVGGARGAGAARSVHGLPGAGEPVGSGGGFQDPGTCGPGKGPRRRACGWECARLCGWCSEHNRTASSRSDPPLSRSLLTFSLALSPSHWLVNNKKKEGE